MSVRGKFTNPQYGVYDTTNFMTEGNITITNATNKKMKFTYDIFKSIWAKEFSLSNIVSWSHASADYIMTKDITLSPGRSTTLQNINERYSGSGKDYWRTYIYGYSLSKSNMNYVESEPVDEDEDEDNIIEETVDKGLYIIAGLGALYILLSTRK